MYLKRKEGGGRVFEEIWEKYKKVIMIGLGVLIVGFCLISSMNKTNGNADDFTPNDFSSAKSNNKQTALKNGLENAKSSNITKTNGKAMVDIKGAVKKPGVYEVKDSMRVNDVIELSGGLNDNADRKNINMAAKVTDQQIIYIPVKGEVKDNANLNSKSDTMASSNSSKDNANQAAVNINSASKEDLLKLNGVGDKKADQIINYRQEQGEFKSIDDLKKVQGIGDKIFDSLKDSITV